MSKVLVLVVLLPLFFKPLRIKSLGVSHWSCGNVLHLLLSTSSAVLRPCGFLVLLRSAVQNRSPLTMLSLELPVFPSLCSSYRKRRGAQSALPGSERIDALRYQRIKKAKKMTMNNNNSKIKKKAGVNYIHVFFYRLHRDYFPNWPHHDDQR